MSLRRLHGWEPRTETVYLYDDDGRLARAVTYTESEWDDEQRGYALALLEHEADRCPGCGGQLAETSDPGAEGRWHVPAPTRCHRCTALAVAQQRDNRRHPEALLWSAERKS